MLPVGIDLENVRESRILCVFESNSHRRALSAVFRRAKQGERVAGIFRQIFETRRFVRVAPVVDNDRRTRERQKRGKETLELRGVIVARENQTRFEHTRNSNRCFARMNANYFPRERKFTGKAPARVSFFAQDREVRHSSRLGKSAGTKSGLFPLPNTAIV